MSTKVAMPLVDKKKHQYYFCFTDYEKDLRSLLSRSATFEFKCERIQEMAKCPEFSIALLRLMYNTDQNLEYIIRTMDAYQQRAPKLSEDYAILFRSIKTEVENLYHRAPLISETRRESHMKIHSKRGQDLKELLTACDAAMKGLMMTLFLEPTCRLRSCNRQFAELIQIGLLAAGVDASALLAPVIEMDRELLKPKPADPPRHAALIVPRNAPARKRKRAMAAAPAPPVAPVLPAPPACLASYSLEDMQVMADIFCSTGLILTPLTHALLEQLQMESN